MRLCVYCGLYVIFFFKQKTADEMRISDWSSDVCSSDLREFEVVGFFDGDGQWRVRFMPDRAGRWSYAWSLGDRSGQGSFQAVPQTDPRVHGHVRRDPDRPRYLRYDDGTPHYWFGGKWFRAENYGEPKSRV